LAGLAAILFLETKRLLGCRIMELASAIPGHLRVTHPGSPILTETGCFVTIGTWRRT
jgi:hypothetical protein